VVLTQIDTTDELTIDWDWYACDDGGNVGHFTSAGLRLLPHSAKLDRELTERLTRYFFHEAKDCSGYSVRTGVEADAGGWKKPGSRDRYLHDFAAMARQGLFSYNTEMRHGRDARYFLVTIPERPLRVTDLPPDIRQGVCRLHAPLLFDGADYISETNTLGW
jgi:hypothetical protein